MEIGDRKTETVNFGECHGKTMTGRVVYIHPQRRFYTVEFEMGRHKFREDFYFPSRRTENE